jgi:hypothetical protein
VAVTVFSFKSILAKRTNQKIRFYLFNPYAIERSKFSVAVTVFRFKSILAKRTNQKIRFIYSICGIRVPLGCYSEGVFEEEREKNIEKNKEYRK